MSTVTLATNNTHKHTGIFTLYTSFERLWQYIVFAGSEDLLSGFDFNKVLVCAISCYPVIDVVYDEQKRY